MTSLLLGAMPDMVASSQRQEIMLLDKEIYYHLAKLARYVLGKEGCCVRERTGFVDREVDYVAVIVQVQRVLEFT